MKFALFILLIRNVASSVHFVSMNIPWPSGIQVDKMTDKLGKEYRFGRLELNAVALRPEWSGVNVIENVFTNSECSEIIEKADKYANKHGWSKGRHVDYDIRPTKDLPLNIIYDNTEELQAVYQRFESVIWPSLSKAYNLNPTLLRPSDLFITKYNASTRERLLGPHRDKSPWSFVVPLNSDFSGGGTYFFDSETLWKPPVGSALFFSGNQLHGGSPITSGVRYILAGFCEYGEDPIALFQEMYNPVYDGYAAQAGFRTGDMIVGLQVCEEVSTADCDVGDAQTCANRGVDETATATEVAGTSGKVVVRRMVEITGDTTDDQWIRYAQSCELLAPGEDTVMTVQRREN